MQIVIRNTEPFSIQIAFENDQIIKLEPDDVVTLHAGLGAHLVVEQDRIQTGGIAPPQINMAETDEATNGLTDPAIKTPDTPNQHDIARSNDGSRPDILHTI